MEIYTVQYLPEKNYELLGMVYGNVVTSKNLVQDIGAVLKKIVGGELGSYTKLLNEARDEATQKMEWEAKQLGADAVIDVRYSTSQIMAGAAEIIVYGTAIKFKQ